MLLKLKSLVVVMAIALSCQAQMIADGLVVEEGAVNSVRITRNNKSMVVYGEEKADPKPADYILFTHYRRDVIWAGKKLVHAGSKAIAPAKEVNYFEHGDSLWSKFIVTRYGDVDNQSTKVGIEPFRIDRFVAGGDYINWEGIQFKVLNTPGFTRGAVSYMTEIAQKKIAFTGDLIYGDGQILDIYSLQDAIEGIKGKQYVNYHGYAARMGQLIESLQLIAGEHPDIIVPVRGAVIYHPQVAIQKLINRLRSLYSNYLSISAYRWYFPERMDSMADYILKKPKTVPWMPYSVAKQNRSPEWLRHISNSFLVFSKDSTAFMIDCGDPPVFDSIMALKKSGRMKRLDGIFITHYHNDHVDVVNALVKAFNCKVFVTSELYDILKNPSAYHMPAMTIEPIQQLEIVADRTKKTWKEFSFTFRYLPGQTIFHDALLVDENNTKNSVFFVGDSFTPSGIDDYCLQNRNLIRNDAGYLYCIKILEELPGHVLLANQHVSPLFSFSPVQLKRITKTLLERERILLDLMPWNNVNFGLDEQWFCIYPYGIKLTPGGKETMTLKIFNHSDSSQLFKIKLNVPRNFSVDKAEFEYSVPAGKIGELTFQISAEGGIDKAISLLTADISFDRWQLREWTEAIIEKKY
jgi:glyoxylase-like metal-dependent hydrolase (beta-lactamase superfamily II)